MKSEIGPLFCVKGGRLISQLFLGATEILAPLAGGHNLFFVVLGGTNNVHIENKYVFWSISAGELAILF